MDDIPPGPLKLLKRLKERISIIELVYILLSVHVDYGMVIILELFLITLLSFKFMLPLIC